MRRVLAPLLVALVMATGVGAATAVLVQQNRTYPSEPGRPGDYARAAIDGLATSHLYVAPDAAEVLPEDERAEVERAAAQADPSVNIAIVTNTRYAGYYLETDLADQIVKGVGRDGVYLVWNGEDSGVAKERGGDLDGYVGTQLEGRSQDALLRYIDEVDANALTEPEPFDYWGGLGGGVAAGALIASGTYPLAVLALGLLRLLIGRPYLVAGRWRDLGRSPR